MINGKMRHYPKRYTVHGGYYRCVDQGSWTRVLVCLFFCFYIGTGGCTQVHEAPRLLLLVLLVSFFALNNT